MRSSRIKDVVSRGSGAFRGEEAEASKESRLISLRVQALFRLDGLWIVFQCVWSWDFS